MSKDLTKKLISLTEGQLPNVNLIVKNNKNIKLNIILKYIYMTCDKQENPDNNNKINYYNKKVTR